MEQLSSRDLNSLNSMLGAEPEEESVGVTTVPEPSKPRQFKDRNTASNPTVDKDADELNEITDDECVSALNSMIRAGESALTYQRSMSRECWDRYNGEFPFGHKEKWQSQVVPPRVLEAVEKTAASLRNSFRQITEWFELETDFKDVNKSTIIKRAVRYHLREANFTSKFSDVTKLGMLSNLLIMNVSWVRDKKVRVGEFSINPDVEYGRLELTVIDPDKVIIDISGRKEYIIVEKEYSYGEFRRMVSEGSYDNAEEILGLEEGVRSSQTGEGRQSTNDSVYRDASKKEQHVVPSVEDKVIIHEFWGKFYHPETGELINDNCVFIMVNNSYVLQSVVDNSLTHKQIPYVVCGMIQVPLSVYHKSPISSSLDMVDLYIEFFNVLVDSIMISSLHQMFVNVDNLDDGQDQLDSAMHPGKMWFGRNDAKPQDTISEIQTLGVSQYSMPFMEKVSQEFQLGTNLPEASYGMTRNRGRMTAKEALSNAFQVDSFFGATADHLDQDFLTPLMRLIYLTILENQPMEADEDFARDVFKNDSEMNVFINSSNEQRFSMLAGNVNFKINILSSMMSRPKELDKMIAYMKVIKEMMGIPNFLESLTKPTQDGKQYTPRFDRMFRKMNAIFGYDTDGFLEEKNLVENPEGQEGQQQQGGQPNLAGLLQLMGQQQQQGGQPGGQTMQMGGGAGTPQLT